MNYRKFILRDQVCMPGAFCFQTHGSNLSPRQPVTHAVHSEYRLCRQYSMKLHTKHTQQYHTDVKYDQKQCVIDCNALMILCCIWLHFFLFVNLFPIELARCVLGRYCEVYLRQHENRAKHKIVIGGCINTCS